MRVPPGVGVVSGVRIRAWKTGLARPAVAAASPMASSNSPTRANRVGDGSSTRRPGRVPGEREGVHRRAERRLGVPPALPLPGALLRGAEHERDGDERSGQDRDDRGEPRGLAGHGQDPGPQPAQADRVRSAA